MDYAAIYAQRAVVMQQGRIAYDGPLRPLISDVDLLQENSLDLPATTKLASQLGPHGVAPWLVSVEELEAALEQIVERPHGH